MKTIVLAAAKGGVGKTSLTAALATVAVQDLPNLRVGLIDLRPAGIAHPLVEQPGGGRVAAVQPGRRALSAVFPGLRIAGFALLFMDSPPGLSPIQREAIAAADLVLVPIQASALDLSAIASTADMAERARVPTRTVLNRAIFRSRIAGQAVETLRGRGNLLWPPMHQRVEISAAMASGRTAVETQPAGAAARELGALWRAMSCDVDRNELSKPLELP